MNVHTGALLALIALLPIPLRAAEGQSAKLRESANPPLLRIASAVAGAQPTSVQDASTTLLIRAGNAGTKKITAQLSSPMPVGVVLTLSVDAPPGAVSLGPVSLDASTRDVVVAIPSTSNTTETMSYGLSASVAAGVVPVSSRTVTLTMLNYP